MYGRGWEDMILIFVSHANGIDVPMSVEPAFVIPALQRTGEPSVSIANA